MVFVDAIGLLADDERLRVVAALVLGARTTEEIANRTSLDARRVLTALTRLETGGLVRHDHDGAWAFNIAALREIAREGRPREEPDDVGDVDAATASVLRTFLRGGRLTQIPMHAGKRRIVLDHICRVFEVGVRYPEREVNALLRAFHPDYAALRRYLVDEGFLGRERNIYWRTGGTVDL
jgi:hypothetical protein